MRRLLAAVAAVVIAATGTFVSTPTAASAHATDRIAGSDRYETSAMISQRSDWSGSTVFLASGAGFADALAAAPVAAAEGAHFMLTDPNTVPESVMWQMANLGTREVVLVGSAATISEGVADQLRNRLGVQVTRIGGRDRVETSLMLLDRLALSGPIDDIWIVSGGNFPDALVAGSVAGRTRSGIVLAYHEQTEAGAAAWLERVRPYVAGRDVRIAGGTPSVFGSLDWQLPYVGVASVNRYAGSDRYDTARIIHDTFTPTAPAGVMLLASGENFPDALSASSYAARHGMPLYLAPSQCHDGIAAMLRGARDQRGVNAIIGLGGPSSLSDRALLLEGCPPPPPPPVVQPPVVTPPAPPAPPAGPYPSPSVRCAHFPTQSAAQAWWNYWRTQGIANPGGLDGDGDGRVCEALRG